MTQPAPTNGPSPATQASQPGPAGPAPSASPAAPEKATDPASTTETKTTETTATQPESKQTETATGPLTADEREELDRLRNRGVEERLWEKRAKANKEAADKWAAHEDSQKTEEQRRAEADAATQRELLELRTDKVRNKVSQETGVPAVLISGSDEESMRASAKAAQDWKGPAAPATSAAPASAVTSTDAVKGPEQIQTRDELAKMSPQEVLKAYREGRLKNLGAVPGQGELRNLQHTK